VRRPKWLARRLRLVGRFVAERRAATALEFAIIAPIFTGLMISVLQTGIFFLAQQNLQEAAVQGARLIMTGQAQSGNMTQSQFLAAVCPSLQTLFTCSNVMANVQTYPSFSAAQAANLSTPTLTYDANGAVSNNWAYNVGTGGQIVVVQLIYQWPLVSGPFSLLMPNLTNGTSLMMGVTAVKVEPY
jgi:Flp pilus assembly protein TadG